MKVPASPRCLLSSITRAHIKNCCVCVCVFIQLLYNLLKLLIFIAQYALLFELIYTLWEYTRETFFFFIYFFQKPFDYIVVTYLFEVFLQLLIQPIMQTATELIYTNPHLLQEQFAIYKIKAIVDKY